MHNWFECKVSYEKLLENGMQRKVTEPYLVDALSFTEAEARIIEELKAYISGEFSIADIKRAKYAEIFFNESGDRFYECGVEFITYDEKSNNEKKTKVRMLCQASSLEGAMKGLSEGMKGTLADYNSVSIKETKIMDVYPYSVEGGEE